MSGPVRLPGEEGCVYVVPRRQPTCGREVPYQSHGRGYYFTCDQPRGHDRDTQPCSGRATDWGAPTL